MERGGIRRIPPGPKIPAQAGIHLQLWPHVRRDRFRDGPLPAQGPPGGEGKPLSPHTASPAHAGASRRNDAEPAAGGSGALRPTLGPATGRTQCVRFIPPQRRRHGERRLNPANRAGACGGTLVSRSVAGKAQSLKDFASECQTHIDPWHLLLLIRRNSVSISKQVSPHAVFPLVCTSGFQCACVAFRLC